MPTTGVPGCSIAGAARLQSADDAHSNRSMSELIQCDAIDAVLRLAASAARAACALSLRNFSAHAALAPHLLAPRVVRTLLALLVDRAEPSKDELREPAVVFSSVQESCLDCLYNLSLVATGRAALVAAGAVASLVAVFRKPSKTPEHNRRCLAVVCNYSFCAPSAARLLAHDALCLVKRLAAAPAAPCRSCAMTPQRTATASCGNEHGIALGQSVRLATHCWRTLVIPFSYVGSSRK